MTNDNNRKPVAQATVRKLSKTGKIGKIRKLVGTKNLLYVE